MRSAGSTAPELVAGRETQPVESWILEPFLHFEPERIYNPLLDLELGTRDIGFGDLRDLRGSPRRVADLEHGLRTHLAEDGWLVPNSGVELGRRFRLKYVSLEAHTVCNQACYFCPVASGPRAAHFMPMELYERVVLEVAAHRSTVEAVFLNHYNEPTLDKRFVDQVRLLQRHGLPPALATNGTGFTPDRVDAIFETGGLGFLSVNLSTLDRQRYAADRKGDHLAGVLKNLEYLATRRLAPEMEIMVLGRGDAAHKTDFEEISRRFAGGVFEVKYTEVMDRAGHVPLGLRPARPHARLRGCEQTGSRPVQWLHVIPDGRCILCCQDYSGRHVVGDLNVESVDEVLAGEPMARLRRRAYGMEEAPDDFICRGCIYALTD